MVQSPSRTIFTSLTLPRRPIELRFPADRGWNSASTRRSGMVQSVQYCSVNNVICQYAKMQCNSAWTDILHDDVAGTNQVGLARRRKNELIIVGGDRRV